MALLEMHGFFRFFQIDDPNIIEFIESECTVLERWGLDLEAVVKELGLLLAEWSALLDFRSQIFQEWESQKESGLAAFSERISGITFFGKDDPEFDRTEIREVVYYVTYGQPSLANVCLFDHWSESCQQIADGLDGHKARLALFDLRGQENRFNAIDGFSKYPRIGLAFWRQAINILLLHFEAGPGTPAAPARGTASTKPPRSDLYAYLNGNDMESFKRELFERGILSGPDQFIPRKNTFHKLTHILALPYMLQHLGVIDASFFECTQLERVDIYAASFSIRFGRNVLSDLAVTDFMTQLAKKEKTDIAWEFYNEIAASVESARIG
ncbi:hypothetical protein [Dyadobacter sandarakinus]|uniref:Uncharacterized protein n=1 Tax=Dyadobacter sandarakinus TaxID=2747268 RepID=A0ABX7I5Y3_9BACT|nr:hypothetical protein [Dyadobacter sandarakinus]QRR00897.1 hypothetical protein HWI92_08265 [Dyadobacter sandarakinus]